MTTTNANPTLAAYQDARAHFIAAGAAVNVAESARDRATATHSRATLRLLGGILTDHSPTPAARADYADAESAAEHAEREYLAAVANYKAALQAMTRAHLDADLT